MQRVQIGRNFKKVSKLRKFIGTPIIYVPVIFFPIITLSGLTVYVHLRIVGATNVRSLRSFIPDWSSHRYHIKNQITLTTWTNPLAKMKWYWMYNCALYCPITVGILTWHAYLAKVVENFWCPFKHGKKDFYTDTPIDKSFWHLNEEGINKLHPEDRENETWNDEAKI